jgi:methionine--tRNA ligase beta chain
MGELVCVPVTTQLMAQSDFDRIARILSLVGVTATANERNLQPHTLLKETLKLSSPALLGNSAEISQWLSVSKTLADSPTSSSQIVQSLEKHLKTRSFLVGTSFTIADAAVLEPLLSHSLVSYPEVNRWSTLIRSFCHCHSTPQNVILPTIFPLMLRQPQELKAAAAPIEQKTDKSEAKQESKNDQKAKDTLKTKEKSKEKKGQSETKTENPPAPGTADADLDPSKLDFRVGIIQKCWEHPEAEKLLCEEINLGESTGPRQIASGLRAHYSAAEIEGRKVIVLANLKDRNMVGFKSQVISHKQEKHSPHIGYGYLCQ